MGLEKIADETIYNILLNVMEMDEMTVKLAYGEISLDDDLNVLNSSGLPNPYYNKVQENALRLMKEYPKEYKKQTSSYLMTQIITSPIKQFRKFLYLRKITKDYKKKKKEKSRHE